MIYREMSQPTNGTVQTIDDALKRKQIQQQLVLIFHACRCQKLYEVNGISPCSNSHCAMMRSVLAHMSECTTEGLCPYSHCSTSKRIIAHWKRCGQLSCLICAPIRKSEQLNKSSMSNSKMEKESELDNAQLKSEKNKEKSFDKFEEVDKNADWRQERMINEIRKSLNSKILVTILPIKNHDEGYEDPKVQVILQQVKQIERKAFLNSKSLQEYYDVLAKNCYYLQRNLNLKSTCENSLVQNSKSNSDANDGNETVCADNIKLSYDSDCVKELHKVIESEYQRQNKLLSESDVKSDPQVEKIKTEPKIEKTENTITKTNDKLSVKIWSDEELLDAFKDLFEYLKSNKVLYQFLNQTDGKVTTLENNKSSKNINLSIVFQKMEEKTYRDPWDIADDINLSIKNAFTISKKSRKLKKDMIQTVSELQDKMDDVMKRLGFCCGREQLYQALPLVCCTPKVCGINKDATYYYYQSESDNFFCCERCFLESSNEVTFLDSNELIVVKKEQLEKRKNNEESPEEFIKCKICKRKWHKVCACYFEEIFPGFHCVNCSEAGNFKRENKFSAKRLPTCVLSRFLEKRVNDYIKKNEVAAENVIIRVLSNVKKIAEVKRRLKSYYPDLPNGFPYRAKAIFAFQEYKGKEICFFGMHVQEYGSDCPQPNQRRVYIAYLDSVRFFEPAKHRTKVYYEMLVGYLDYVKKLGYVWAHIWACPPSEGDDYIFHIHPPDQKIPKPKRLQEWYVKMLDKGIQELVVNDYKDIVKDAQQNNVKSVTEIAYFEGDLWPNVIEDLLKESEENSKRTKNVEDDDAESLDGNESLKDYNSKKPKKRKQKKMTTLTNSKKRKVNENIDTTAELYKKALEAMDKHKENFFTIRLYPEQDIPNLPETIDKDATIESDLMDGRENFLHLARTKRLEFSSIRRALYSTLVSCYELHNDRKQPICYSCNVCNDQVVVCYHCTVCYEYDLCEKCYSKEKHEHELQLIKPYNEHEGDTSEFKSDSNYVETSRVRLDKLVKTFEHASTCRDVNCRLIQCAQMKQMLFHCKSCTARSNCQTCKQIYMMSSIHAKYCANNNCNIHYCQTNKASFRKNDNKQRLRQKKLIRRRTEIMRYNINSSNNSSSTSTSENVASVSSSVAQSPHPYAQTSGPMSNSSLSNNIDGTPPKAIKQESCFTKTPVYSKPSTIVPENANVSYMYTNGSYNNINKPMNEVEYIENVYKTCMHHADGQMKFSEFLKNNPNLSHAFQLFKQKHSGNSMMNNPMFHSNIPPNTMISNVNNRYHNNLSPYVPGNHMPQQFNINGSQPYNVQDIRCINTSKMNMVSQPSIGNQAVPMNRFPIMSGHMENFSNQQIVMNNFGTPIPGHNSFRFQSNHPPISNGMMNPNPQIYTKMMNQKPFNPTPNGFQPTNDSHIFRTSQHSYY